MWPAHDALAHTRVLDIRGWLRAASLQLPVQLDTLRTYEYYAHPPGPLSRKTLLWGTPQYPSARRLVLFSTLEQCKHVKYRPQVPRFYPPGVQEVVLNLRLPGRGGEWGRLDVPPSPPPLERVTVIFAPSLHEPACREGRDTASLDASEGEPAYLAIADLVAIIVRLGAPTTLVGWEKLDQRLVKRGVLASLEEAGVSLRRSDEVRSKVGRKEWSILTREAPLPSTAWMTPQSMVGP